MNNNPGGEGWGSTAFVKNTSFSESLLAPHGARKQIPENRPFFAPWRYLRYKYLDTLGQPSSQPSGHGRHSDGRQGKFYRQISPDDASLASLPHCGKGDLPINHHLMATTANLRLHSLPSPMDNHKSQVTTKPLINI